MMVWSLRVVISSVLRMRVKSTDSLSPGITVGVTTSPTEVLSDCSESRSKLPPKPR
ncbi:hypothetical protein D3C83_314480 [compost metagenome]